MRPAAGKRRADAGGERAGRSRALTGGCHGVAAGQMQKGSGRTGTVAAKRGRRALSGLALAGAAGLNLLEEVVALVVDQDKGRKIYHFNLPYGLHA